MCGPSSFYTAEAVRQLSLEQQKQDCPDEQQLYTEVWHYFSCETMLASFLENITTLKYSRMNEVRVNNELLTKLMKEQVCPWKHLI